MTWDMLFTLAGIAFFAGFVDAIAGGGGLITLPALFLSGVDPVSAIATNKLQSTSGSISATIAFWRKGLIQWKQGRLLMLFAFLGGVAGALLVSAIEKKWLEIGVPFLLILVAFYFMFSPQLRNEDHQARLSLFLFSLTLAPLLGFYDGVFGPGVGSFFMIGFVFLCGLGVIRAIGFTKLANASCNLGALLVFISKGLVLWPLGIVMACSAILGAQVGVRAAVSIGPRLVKPMLIVVCLVLAIKLLSSESHPLHIGLSHLGLMH